MTSPWSPNNVHPLFDQTRFAPNIDYDRAIRDFAVLATRLMNSPQAQQHDFCFFFGKNVPANAPVNYTSRADGPRQYACDKGIGELDETDIQHVEQQRIKLGRRIRFEVNDLGGTTVACCEPQTPREGVRGCNSIIHIDRKLYDAVLAQGQSADDMIRIKFKLTCAMLHELAHAAHHHLFGHSIEDFREDSNIAEAGFEFESRIFGQKPHFALTATNPNHRVTWIMWQSRALPAFYDLDEIARNAWQVPKSAQPWTDGLGFVTKLFDDGFWEGEYVEHGARALIPGEIASSCLARVNNNMFRSIPLSIKDLFREGGPSYAQKKYARFANPERKLRGSA